MDVSIGSGQAKGLRAMQQEFKKQLPEKIADIAKYLESATDDGSVQDELYRKLVSLADSAGTYGAAKVSTIARELEQKIKSNYDKEADSSYLMQSFEQLKQAANDWVLAEMPLGKDSDILGSQDARLIYVLLGDDDLVENLGELFGQSGYEVQLFSRLEELEEACKRKHPVAIIMDTAFTNNGIAGTELITEVKAKLEACHPLIYISEKDDVEHRLAAARAGADRFFNKPLNISKLTQTVSALQTSINTAPYRVLIIDNDLPLLELYQIMLQESGMIVEALSNPLECIKLMATFKPDVVITDIYMPECSGPELVQMIRQDDQWALVPILFLSGEQNINTQLGAMKLGADDFLTKPVDLRKLRMMIEATAKRARQNLKLNNDLKNALRENKYQLETMDQHDIVSAADISGRIISVNDKFSEISGYSREELLGQNHRILKSGLHSDSFYKDIWNTISNGEVWRGTICNLKKSGEEYWVNSTIVPFLDDKGRPYKYVSARTDVTDLRRSQERMDRSQEFANIGTWDWNILTGELYWSDRIWPLFGYKKENTDTTYDNFLEAVHPDDRQQVIDAVNDCVEQGTHYNIEHRVVWPDGSEHWMQESGDVVRSKEGKALHMLGVVQDITARKRAEFELQENERKQHGNNNILQMIAKQEPLSEILEALVLHAEVLLKGSISSILLLDHTGKRLKSGVAPGLPVFYNNAINGLEIGMGVGSCGEAAFSGKRVIAEDVMSHPNWVNFKELVEKAKLRACWSEPFFSSTGAVLGTFAIYYSEPKKPIESDLNILIELAQFAAIAVDSDLSNKALVLAKEDAENANHAKSQFLSSMSHELRTPMNAIMGFGQLMKLETESPLNKSQMENVNEIMGAAKHLMELINEVLDLAKIEVGRIDLTLEKVMLGQVIADALQLVMSLAENRGIDISMKRENTEISYDELVQQGVAVRADSTRLKQALLNLLSNAVKYNNDNGKIIINCSRSKNNFIRINISDTGNGLSEEQLEGLFVAFNRLGAEQSEIEGTGIGLVITKNIIELMGGNIGVESEKGKGSTFWIELPEDTENLEDESMKNDTDEKSALKNLEQEHTVLYIEDNPANLRLVSQLLGRLSNIRMWSAHEPLLGLELAMQHKPDLILLDINLPGMDGFEVLKRLQADEKTCMIPVIAISANAMPKDIDKGLNAGFEDYITKPIDVQALLQSVDKKLSE